MEKTILRKNIEKFGLAGIICGSLALGGCDTPGGNEQALAYLMKSGQVGAYNRGNTKDGNLMGAVGDVSTAFGASKAGRSEVNVYNTGQPAVVRNPNVISTTDFENLKDLIFVASSYEPDNHLDITDFHNINNNFQADSQTKYVVGRIKNDTSENMLINFQLWRITEEKEVGNFFTNWRTEEKGNIIKEDSFYLEGRTAITRQYPIKLPTLGKYLVLFLKNNIRTTDCKFNVK